MTSVEKVKINAYVPRELDETMRLHIAEQYPLEIHGKYSLSIEAALIASLGKNGSLSSQEFRMYIERLRNEGLNESDIERVCLVAGENYDRMNA